MRGWFRRPLILLAAHDAASEQAVDHGSVLSQRHPSDRLVEDDQPPGRRAIVRATAVRQEEHACRRSGQPDEDSHDPQYGQ